MSEARPVPSPDAPRRVPARVLVASPDTAYAALLRKQIELERHHVELCHDAKGLLQRASQQPFDVLVLDVALGSESDVDLVSYVRRRSPDTQLVLLFDIPLVDKAIDGVRQGAFFYLPKQCTPADVALIVRKAVKALDTGDRLHEVEMGAFETMLGSTPAMRRVIELVTKVAPTDSTVLLLGESGTGKDVLAGAIHRLSARRDMPYIAINCAALPEQLLESEMFGHVKGAFTGAHTDKPGLFQEADGGTIFLDEIGDMAPATQAKLLRVLQNGEVRPVGASASARVDVRVIAATNQDLEEAVRAKTFREDLYFRLNVIQIRIPPLRDRKEIIPRLADYFMQRFSRKYGKHILGYDDHAAALMRNYDYPGNIRELESIVAHAVILCDGDRIHARDLPDQVRTGTAPRLALPNYTENGIPTLTEMEERLIREALVQFDGNQTEAAKHLGISRSTLWRKLKEYGINT